MTGNKKKISVHISKKHFMDKMDFSDNKELKKRCSKYLDLKGVAYHVVIANAFDLNKDGKIKYKFISNLYIYDKRLRNILYKYLAAFEEQIRASLANSYSNGLERVRNNELIREKIQSGSNIAYVLEDLEFGKLLQIVEKLTEKDWKKMFPNSDEHLIQNLYAVKELRNAVSHHRIISLYDDFEYCYVNGIKDNSLTNNIKNLCNLINKFYNPFLIRDINNAINDNEDSNFYIPDEFIVKL